MGDTADTFATQAIRFLTDRSGHAAHWRNRWCSYLDMDGDQLAARVRQILDGEINPPDMRGVALARARERWALLRPATSTAPKASPTPPTRLPSIKRPPPPPVARPTLEPQDVDLIIPDDPFHLSQAGHLVASRPWADGEVSGILGPLPRFHSKTGQLIWTLCQTHRNGFNGLYNLSITAEGAVTLLQTALPHCDVLWTSRGERLTEHRPKACLRLYLKEPALAA